MVKIKKQSTKDWDTFVYDTLRELPDSTYIMPDPPEEREVLITKQIIKDMAADMLAGADSRGLKYWADKYGVEVKHMKRFAKILKRIIAEVNAV